MTDTPSIFLSHTTTDALVAHAIKAALDVLFGRGTVTVSYSTSKEMAGSPEAGADWFEWITKQVRNARRTLVLLTPASVQQPWILWETGAVFGAAAVDPATSMQRVIPLTFGLAVTDVPDPMVHMRLQTVAGDNEDAVRKLLNSLVTALQDVLPDDQWLPIAQSVPAAVQCWLEGTTEAMRLAPLVPTEAVVAEWLSRFTELADSGRANEVDHLHQWMIVAFGRDGDAAERPLDVRLHRRLGDLYSAADRHDRAASQYLLAHKLAPRDIYTLRFLGKAYLDAGRHEEAGKVVDDIDQLDPRASAVNPECAALKGRWLIAVDEAPRARDVYAEALEHNRRSTYLADLLGQVSLKLGDRRGAAAAYRQAAVVIDELAEQNIWTHATAATGAIVSDDADGARRHLVAIAALKPTLGDLATIERGLLDLQGQLGVPADEFSTWRGWLRDPAPALP